MKLFIDTANIDQIREAAALGVIDGVTTNPSLIAREGKDFISTVKEICSIVDGPVNVEVTGLKTEQMVKEARELVKLHQNIVIKIPMIKEGLKAVKIISEEGIKVTMTLVFSCSQALLAAKAGASYVAPFIGRLDDIGYAGMDLVRNMRTILNNYNFPVQIIVASIRSPLHVIDAALAGADIATMPLDVIEKMIKHPLTDIGLEKFLADWGKIPSENHKCGSVADNGQNGGNNE